MGIGLTSTFSDLDDAKKASVAAVVKETAQRISRQFSLENIQFAM